MANSVKSVFGPVRFSYVHVFQPWKADEDSKEQYTATLLIPKSDKTLVEKIRKDIKQAFDLAVTEKWGGKAPKDGFWFDPLQDGDSLKQDGEPRGEAYEDCWFINAKSNEAPGVVDKNRQNIIDSEEFYSGCYGYASVAFSGFTFGKKMGISCFLNNLMKTKDGEPLGSAKTDAASDFGGIAVDGDDDM